MTLLDSISTTEAVTLVGCLILAAGLWLALPRGQGRGRAAGLTLSLVGLGLLAAQVVPFGGWIAEGLFFLLAGVAVVSAVCAVSFRSPVYCAIWFALMLLSIGALFLFQGAQFLGVATVVVYAGAILVTFLFVLMLAQPEGHSTYDRITWEPLLAATAGAAMLGLLSIAIGAAMTVAPDDAGEPAADGRLALVDQHTAEQRDADILNSENVLYLGARLFSEHLIAVEAAGVMLLAALVGAVAIAARDKPLAAPQGGPRHG